MLLSGLNKIKDDTRGFSLLELMIVVSMIGIMSTVAIPYFYETTLPQIRARTAARNLYMKMQLARSEAVNKKVQHGIRFNLSVSQQDRYEIVDDSNNNCSTDPANWNTVSTSYELESGVDIQSIGTIESGVVIIDFNCDGSAGSPGDITIRDNNNTRSYRITLNTFTGRIRIE